MGVFDVLRYPISDLPTAEELAALPKDIYDEWTKVAWDGVYYTPTSTADWYKGFKDKGLNFQHGTITILRKMIKDYDGCI